MAAVCPTCGSPVTPGADFCENPGCGAYIGWDATLIGTRRPTPTPPTPPTGGERPAPPRPPSGGPIGQPPHISAQHQQAQPGPSRSAAGMATKVSSTSVFVAPGETDSVQVTVRNTSSLVEQYRVAVHGEAAGFAWVDPPELRLYPGDEGSVTVTFAPPRATHPPAGAHRWTAVVSSTISPGAEGLDGTTVVSGFTEVAASTATTRTKGRGTAFSTRVELQSSGNEPAQVTLTPHDSTHEITFPVPSSQVQLAPGQSAAVPIEGRTKRSWFGRAKSLPYLVHVSSGAVTGYAGQPGQPAQPAQPGGPPLPPAGQQLQLLNLTRLQKAIFPPWLPVAVLALIGLLVWAVLAWLSPDDVKVPAIARGATVAEATQKLEAVGLKSEIASRQDAEVPAGMVIGTDPAAGVPVEEGQSVTVYVSSGSAGEKPIVPSLEGKTEAQAREDLSTIGLEYRVSSSEPHPSIAAGSIVRQSPAAGTPLNQGDEVAVVLSTGPETSPSASVTDGGDGKLVVPLLSGSADLAQGRLEGMGFTAVQREERYDDVVPAGEVIGTDPGADQEVEPDAPITLIVSKGPEPFALADLAPDVTWLNGDGTQLEFGVATPPEPGLVLFSEDRLLEDDQAYEGSLITEPQEVPFGAVYGDFPIADLLAEGDTFTARIGMRQDADGDVKFSVIAVRADGSPELLFEQVVQGDDGVLDPVSVSLATLNDLDYSALRLHVSTEEAPGDDRAVWVEPGIVRSTP